jgi:hypothetical protein
MLADPRPALAERSEFHHALVGLAGLAGVIRALAAGSAPADPTGAESTGAELIVADDLVHALLGMVSVGEAVARLAAPVASAAARAPAPGEPVQWLR